MKVFLDTNILASAVATRGLCADVMRETLTSHELVISQQMLKELKQVLKVKFNVPPDLITDFMALLQQDSVMAQPVRLPRVKLREKDDLVILAAAIAAGTEMLVTGDKELLGLRAVGDLQIVSPRQFWENLKTHRRRGRRHPNPHR